MVVCSVNDPSLAANVFHSRWAPYIDSVNAMPLTALAAASAARRSPIFVSSGTANGSSATGVSNEPCAGGRSSRTTGRRSAVADARAMRTASAATRSTSAGSRRFELAKPHAPSTRTRTPKPSDSPEATPSTRPDLMEIDSSRRRTTRMSAYVAPRRAAVSRARSVRSRIARQGIRGACSRRGLSWSVLRVGARVAGAHRDPAGAQRTGVAKIAWPVTRRPTATMIPEVIAGARASTPPSADDDGLRAIQRLA